MTAKTDAQRRKKCDDGKRARGLVLFQEWVTKPEKIRLQSILDEMRRDKTTTY